MVTTPEKGIFNSLTVDVIAGPLDEVDTYHVPVSFGGLALDLLTDDDIDAIAQTVVDRLVALHPDCQVDIEQRWTGFENVPRTTAYTPPAE